MRITNEEAKDGCKLGQMVACCAFLGIGPDGFECLKADPKCNATIAERLKAGNMNAKGEGNWEGCKYKEVFNGST